MTQESNFHIEQPVKERRTKPKTENQLSTESIERQFSGKTDRQLLEEQTFLARQRTAQTLSIKKNVQLAWFIILILGSTAF